MTLKTYCLVLAGLVVDRTIFDGEKPDGWGVPGDVWIADEAAQIGWSFDGATFAPPPSPPPPPVTISNVVAEQRRRLSLGFDFDFGDGRGVHHIATTEQDMKDWSEVTTWATVKLLTGDLASTLTIATNTGVAAVTAPEWMAVLEAGTQARQPIFAGAFYLMAQDPIPADYATNEAYWSGQ